jgi:hypothetical protein
MYKIDIDENSHPELYSMPIDNCLNFLKNIKSNNKDRHEKFKFHSYWYVGKEFGEKQTLLIKSYLSTQNLKNTEFILWCNQDLSENEYIKEYLKFITFKKYDPFDEAKGTPIENMNHILEPNDVRNWPGGDLFRLLILHNYGGIYLDMDMVMLRDFSPLFNQEFMYKWGCKDEYDFGGINGACMGIFRKSKLSYDLLNTLIHHTPGDTSWSTELYTHVRQTNDDWTIFPSAFFNSEWHDDVERNWGSHERNAFNDHSFKMYDGAFSWHWHNRWDDQIHPNSKWAHVKKIIDSKYEDNIKTYF